MVEITYNLYYISEKLNHNIHRTMSSLKFLFAKTEIKGELNKTNTKM